MSEETKYYVRSSEKLGRYLVAARALRAGEVILREAPLVVGPASDSPLLCFQCHAPLAGKFSCCPLCRCAPVCADRACANTDKSARRWHDEAECSLFSSGAGEAGAARLSALALVGRVAALTPLRCLLKRSADPAAWRRLASMEHHLDERRGTDIWRYHQSTVEFIESLGLVGPDDDAELVQKLCGIVDVNSFEVRGGGGGGGGAPLALRGVYPRAALMAHHCVGNTHLAVGADHALTVRAARDIAPGDLIYNNYVDALQGTAKRQERLQIGKYFTCECERCLDPTELGTHLSSLACVACRAGLVAPPPPRAAAPRDHHRTDTSHLSKDTKRDSFDVTSLQVKNDSAGTKEDCSENPNSVLPLLDRLSENKSICNENGVSIEIGSSTPNYKPDDEHIPNCAETEIKIADSADSNDTKTDKANVTNGGSKNVNIESIGNTARDARWSCEECGEKFSGAAMEEKVRACSNKLASIDKCDERSLEEYISVVSGVLSPRHYLVLEAAQTLAGVLRARIHRAPRPTAHLLRTMLHHCTELLAVLEILRPGISRAKAITLYELQATSVHLAKKLFEAREITAEAYMSELEQGERVLRRAVGMLVVEPSGSPEGELCAHALQELRDLRGAARALADARGAHAAGSTC